MPPKNLQSVSLGRTCKNFSNRTWHWVHPLEWQFTWSWLTPDSFFISLLKCERSPPLSNKMFMLYLAMNFGHGEANLWHHHMSLLRKLCLTDNINQLDVDINTNNDESSTVFYQVFLYQRKQKRSICYDQIWFFHFLNANSLCFVSTARKATEKFVLHGSE